MIMVDRFAIVGGGTESLSGGVVLFVVPLAIRDAFRQTVLIRRTACVSMRPSGGGVSATACRSAQLVSVAGFCGSLLLWLLASPSRLGSGPH